MQTEDFGTDRNAFLEALHGKPRQKRGRATRPDIPSVPAGEGDRLKQLERIAAYRFWPRYRVGIGFDFWHIDGRTTTLCQDYVTACVTAERELKG